MKIFGKEPAFWLGILQAVLAFFLTVDQLAGGLHLTDERVGVIMATLFAVVGVWQAWLVRDTMLAAVTGLAKAMIALLAAYKFELTPDQIAGVLGILTLVVDGWFTRDRTSPLVNPSFSNSPTAPVLTLAA